MSAIYWRINITANNASSNTSIGEMEMHTSIGGSDVCSGGTATASGTLGGPFVAASAFDNNNATMWNTGGVGWLQYAHASAVAIVEYTVQSRHDGYLADSPKDWFFLFSLDNVQWFVVDARTNQTSWGLSEKRTYATTISITNKLVWRVRVTAANGGSSVSIGEIEMRPTVGGADQCSGGYALANAYLNGFPPDNAFNNNGGTTFWHSNNTIPCQISYQFPNAVEVGQLAITTRGDGYTNEAPKDIYLEYFDGSEWQVAAEILNQTGWSANETRLFTIEIPAAEITGTFAATESTDTANIDGTFTPVESNLTTALAIACTINLGIAQTVSPFAAVITTTVTTDIYGFAAQITTSTFDASIDSVTGISGTGMPPVVYRADPLVSVSGINGAREGFEKIHQVTDVHCGYWYTDKLVDPNWENKSFNKLGYINKPNWTKK